MKKYGDERRVITEKFKMWNYVDNWGNRVWLNKYGDIVKKQSKEGIYFDGNSIKIKWSPELIQDLNAYHAVDVEAELTALLSEEIGAEIDRNIVAGLFEIQNGQ
jgi:hypothetical protein